MPFEALSAIEFFSGIGAFAEACRDTSIAIVAAYDQNHLANQVYQANFPHTPLAKNLESISAADLPSADVWWMSPPCTPFSRRGKQRDDEDPRAGAFLNLIKIMPKCRPGYVFVENVLGFANSNVDKRLKETLTDAGYSYRCASLCSSDFGIPMRRPRYFISAWKNGNNPKPDIHRGVWRDSIPERESLGDCLSGTVYNTVSGFETVELITFLEDKVDERLILPAEEAERYKSVLNIVDPEQKGAYLICFTSGYFKCRKASGSLLQLRDGRVRFCSPEEILSLMGFSKKFFFPEDIPLPARFKLVGNSVDVRAIRSLLSPLTKMQS